MVSILTSRVCLMCFVRTGRPVLCSFTSPVLYRHPDRPPSSYCPVCAPDAPQPLVQMVLACRQANPELRPDARQVRASMVDALKTINEIFASERGSLVRPPLPTMPPVSLTGRGQAAWTRQQPLALLAWIACLDARRKLLQQHAICMLSCISGAVTLEFCT